MFTFSDALVFMREGQRVRRTGWNNPMAYVSLVYVPETGGDTLVYTDTRVIEKDKRAKHAWLASHLDILAKDWELVKETKQ